MHSDAYELISFKLGKRLVMNKLFIFISVNDLDFHSRSQAYETARTCAIILILRDVKVTILKL